MKRIVICPSCKFGFDISYVRIFACKSCPSSIIESCGMAKCPKCGQEFPIR